MEQISPNSPLLTPSDYQAAESPAWASFFTGFPAETPLEVKAQMVQQFVKSISDQLNRVYNATIRRMKERKASFK